MEGSRVSLVLLGLFWCVGIASLALAGRAWQRRVSLPGAGALTLLLISTAAILLPYGLSFAPLSPQQVIWWIDLTYLGWLVGPTALLVFVSKLTGRDRWLRPAVYAMLAIEPIAVGIVIFSPDGEDLFFAGGRDLVTYDFPASGVYWIFIAYIYGLLGVATVMVILTARSSPVLHRRQVAFITILVLLPWVMSLMSVVNVKFLGADPTVLALILLVAFAYALTQFRLLDIRPLVIAGTTAGKGDGVIVIDSAGRIADVNSTAMALMGSGRSPVMGLRVEDVWREDADLVAALLSSEAETTVKPSGQPVILEKAPLRDARGQERGVLVIVRAATPVP